MNIPKRTCTLCFLIILFSMITIQSVHGQETVNPGFDVSGVKAFWKVVNILREDIEPSADEWKMLFDTPGHNALRREFEDEFFIRYFKAAYMPSESHVRDEILAEAEKASGWFRSWFPKSELDALDWTLKNRETVVQKMYSLEQYPYTEQAVHELLKFLPETRVDEYPNVSFVIFNDSRGYDPVVMSLNNLAREEAEMGDTILKKLKNKGLTKEWPHVLYFAHEFFHFYRDKKLNFTYPPRNDDDYTLVWLLDQIENEGIADQINVKQLYYGDGCYAGTEAAQKVYDEQAAAPEEIRKFDAILAGIHDHSDWKYGLGQQARRTITRSGHVAGFFMSNVILKHYPKDDLVRAVRNPFKFFYLYNEAAIKEGSVPVFSDKSIAVVKSLEEKYSR